MRPERSVHQHCIIGHGQVVEFFDAINRRDNSTVGVPGDQPFQRGPRHGLVVDDGDAPHPFTRTVVIA